jgi:NADH dehydrogenase (ubiquinone) 1 alpha/beta subcomplex 1
LPGYYLDPKLVATRIVMLIGCYDKVEDVSKIKLTTQWHELGLDEIDVVNITVAIEKEFEMEFIDEEVERFKNIEDVVNYVARSFHAK